MATLELVVRVRVPGDPSDVGNADDVAVQVSFKNTGAASRAAKSNYGVVIDNTDTAVSSSLDLCSLLQVLGVGVHLSQH